MIETIYKHTLLLVLLFAVFASYGQKNYDSDTKAATRNLEGKTLSGYVSNFNYEREIVRKGWWSYAREFGTPLDMRTYYKVTIPSETTDGNLDLQIFTQSVGEGESVDFFLGVAIDKYREQARLMLLDFKKMFYIQQLVNEIEKKQGEADDLGRAYKQSESNQEKKGYLKKITSLESQIDELTSRIKFIEREY